MFFFFIFLLVPLLTIMLCWQFVHSWVVKVFWTKTSNAQDKQTNKHFVLCLCSYLICKPVNLLTPFDLSICRFATYWLPCCCFYNFLATTMFRCCYHFCVYVFVVVLFILCSMFIIQIGMLFHLHCNYNYLRYIHRSATTKCYEFFSTKSIFNIRNS